LFDRDIGCNNEHLYDYALVNNDDSYHQQDVQTVTPEFVLSLIEKQTQGKLIIKNNPSLYFLLTIGVT